jgi:hypothetical protein
MTAEMMTENEIEAIVNEVRSTLTSMRKAKLLSRGAIMTHIGKNNAILRNAAIKLEDYGMEIGSTRETRKLMIWNEYLKMELERVTKIPSDMRVSRAITAKADGITKIKQDNNAAVTAFLNSRR